MRAHSAISNDFSYLDAPAHLSAQKDPQPPILVIQHSENAGTGYVGLVLKQLGHALDIRRPFLGDGLPHTLDHHAGTVVFGGPMSANDNEDYLHRELDWLSIPLEEEKPYLGICLGAQLLAKSLGATVAPDPDGHSEIGYYPLQTKRAVHDDLTFPERVMQWHFEGFTLPDGSELLCEGLGAFQNQAFRYGPAAFAVQFHPEATVGIVTKWINNNPDIHHRKGAQAKDDIIETHLAEAHHVRDWLRQFLTAWVGLQPAADAAAKQQAVR